MSPGIYNDLDPVAYHAAPAISKSALAQFRKSPAHYKAWIANPPEQTPAMRLGTLAHMAVFEPERYARSVAMAPLVDKRTKEGKSIWQQFQTQNEGRELVTIDEHQQLQAMAKSVREHTTVAPFFVDLEPEVSIFVKCADTKLMLKARLDGWSKDRKVILDLKTTEDASPAAFARSVLTFTYHIQAAHYSALADQASGVYPRFLFVAVEKSEPYAVAVYELDIAAMAAGSLERCRLIEQFASCQEFDTWPSYPSEIQSLSLPKWATTNP